MEAFSSLAPGKHISSTGVEDRYRHGGYVDEGQGFNGRSINFVEIERADVTNGHF